jgi:3-methyl-2-oxobutanoate hydroxymethyltransferase
MSSTRSNSKRSDQKVTVPHVLARKAAGERITVLTAYDYPTARLLDAVPELDIILVGDSLGMVELGYETTVPVTMDDMLHHCRAVRRGVQRALIVADMPFLSYQTSADDALRNAGRLLQEGGANAVKLEGGRTIQPIIRRLVDTGIPVMAHVGLTPQSVNLMGMRVQGRSHDDAQRIEEDALAVQDAGAFAIVLELVPIDLADRITQKLRIPTIGIGSGPHCDGQVLVISDMIALHGEDSPAYKHVRHYANVGAAIRDAVTNYCSDVRSGQFPADGESFS